MVKRNLSSDMAMATTKRAKTSATKSATKAYVSKIARSAVIRMAEKKRITTEVQERALSTLSPGATADWVDTSLFPSGADRASRVGQQVMLQSLHLRGQLHNNAAGVKIIRFLVGYIKDQTAPSSVSEIFEAPVSQGTAGTGDNTNLALYRRINPVKFQVLRDRIYKLGGVNTADGTNTQVYKMTIPLRNKKLNFESIQTGLSNQDYRLYAIALCQRSDNDDVSGSTIEWTQVSHLSFIDI